MEISPKNKIELLAPAGSMIKLKAAIASGADAVYLGLDRFNAREFAPNFTKEDFEEAVKLCKSNNVKMYLTSNTLIKNNELEAFFDQLKFAYESGIDAVIIQDPSFIPIIKKSFPSLHIHISTQAGIMNSEHANLFKGIDRINLARELNKANIESIRKNFKEELEIFIHGALCASISGSCLFSSLLGGRSGNRGMCAQPCRKLYNDSFIFSTKELLLMDKIPELIKMNINSLKIEGRMRTPYYVGVVTSNYRKAIDSYYKGEFKVTPAMRAELATAFSRDFTEGNFSGDEVFNTLKASGTSSPKPKLFDVRIKDIKIEKRKANKVNLEIEEKNSKEKQMIVRVYNEKDALLADNYADIICLDLFNPKFEEIKSKIKKPLYAVTQRIMFDSDLVKIEERIKKVSPAGIFAGNVGILNMNLGLPVILDYNCNCFNDSQVGYYEKLGGKPILSPELSISEIEQFKNKNFILFVHGKMRLMTLAHQIKEDDVRDEKGFYFLIRKIPNGVEVLNDKELGLFNKIRLLPRKGINQIYIDTESNEDYSLGLILKFYREILDGKSPDVSSIQKHYVLGWSKQGVL